MPRSGNFGDIRANPRNQRIMKWLRRKPSPATVIGETADGDEVKAVVNSTGPTTWSDVLSVVRPCVRLEALDERGQALRALELEPDDPELRAEAIASSMPGSVPIISIDIPRLVDNLARNMREVAAESARQQAGAFKEGFGAMTQVVQLCLGLLVRVDQRMAELEEQADAQRDEQQPPEGNPRNQLAMLALQKAVSGGTNGAGADLGALLQMVQHAQQQGGDT